MKSTQLYLIFCILSILTGCGPGVGPLTFIDKSLLKNEEPFRVEDNSEAEYLEYLKKLKKDYEQDLSHLTVKAKESFEPIKEVFDRKCFDCHDSTRKLPLYGRIFPRVNPVKKHQVEGLMALDMAKTYPLKAKGDPPQLSLLKAIKAATIDQTMPLKSYLVVYPFRRISKKNQVVILNWVNPLIEEHERIEERYRELFEGQSIDSKVKRLFAKKCIRCHGSGNARGSFGGMDDLDELSNRQKYVNKDNPEKSLIYTVSLTGEMPTDPRERLSEDELATLLEWIQSLSKVDTL